MKNHLQTTRSRTSPADWLSKHPMILSTLAATAIALLFVGLTSGIETDIRGDSYNAQKVQVIDTRTP